MSAQPQDDGDPMPIVTRVGDVVIMPASDFDDLIARLLLAERRRRPSWWRGLQS